jgi:fructose-bisphosphate aldolase, class I
LDAARRIVYGPIQTQFMKSYRLNRLFNPVSRRCFDVAVDHGFFGEHSFHSGIEDLDRVVRTLVEAAPDAIQLTPGMARLLQAMPVRPKPALVLRTDVANCYGVNLPARLFAQVIEDAVEQAVRLDAACVVVNLLQVPGHAELTESCIHAINQIKPQCDRYAMPLMIEPLVFQPNEKAGGYMVDGDTKKIVALVRQAAELGADVIKADPTDRVEDYHQVIQTTAGLPVLVRGGGKVSDREILHRTQSLLEQGAAGIVYGRNVIQHPNPAALTKALMGVVHQSLSAEDAARTFLS